MCKISDILSKLLSYLKFKDQKANKLGSIFVCTEKAGDKISVCKFSKIVKFKLYYIDNSKTRGQTVDLDEVAHFKPHHQDLHCLQIQLFLSLVPDELIRTDTNRTVHSSEDNMNHNKMCEVSLLIMSH